MPLKSKESQPSLIVSGARKNAAPPKPIQIEAQSAPSYRPNALQTACESMAELEAELGIPPIHASIAALVQEQTPLMEDAARRHGTSSIDRLIKATSGLLGNFSIESMTEKQKAKFAAILDSLKDIAHVGVAAEGLRNRIVTDPS